VIINHDDDENVYDDYDRMMKLVMIVSIIMLFIHDIESLFIYIYMIINIKTLQLNFTIDCKVTCNHLCHNNSHFLSLNYSKQRIYHHHHS
jgi:hypothetical protein